MFDPKARAGGGQIRYYESDDSFVEMVRRATDRRHHRGLDLLPRAREPAARIRTHRHRSPPGTATATCVARCSTISRRARRRSSAKGCSSRSASSSRPSRRTSASPTASSVLNLCANNYLGLADDPEHRRRRTHARWTSTATAWPRCVSSAGRNRCTRSWKRASSAFLGTDDTILYSSCFDANGGLFETILDEQDAVISDSLNHASIIDGIRLCRARRFDTTTATWRSSSSGCRRPPMPATG